MEKHVCLLGVVRCGSGGRWEPPAHEALTWAPVLDEEGSQGGSSPESPWRGGDEGQGKAGMRQAV